EHIVLDRREPLPAHLSVDECRRDVVAWIAAALFRKGHRILEELHDRDLCIHRATVVRILCADETVAPAEELPAILTGDAKKLRDHEKRELRRDLRHEVAFSLVCDFVHDLARELAHMDLEAPDRA